MRYLLLLSIAVFAPGIAFCQGDEPAATIEGPVTRFVSLNDFDVNGVEVISRPKTQFRLFWPNGSSIVAKQPVRLFIGEHAAVFQLDGSEVAKKVEIFQPSVHAVDGTATVEAVLPGMDLEVRADGYRIRIGPETKVQYVKPFAAANDIKPNAVLHYKGMLQKDGIVLASRATFFENEVTADILEARKEWEYDPSVVPAESHQSRVSRGFRGIDARYFPLHADATMQARVSIIGEKLIPEYQKKMTMDEKSRIHFRFYVVDGPKNPEAYYPLPSGIVLVPYQAVQKLPDDSELAAVLADAIACLIEVQPIALPMTDGQITQSAVKTAVEIAAIGAIGTSIVNASADDREQKNAEQRARVSLSLMRDAGFDETAAPKAWWALSGDESMPLATAPPPPMVTYLYDQVAEHEAAEAVGLVGKRR